MSSECSDMKIQVINVRVTNVLVMHVHVWVTNNDIHGNKFPSNECFFFLARATEGTSLYVWDHQSVS